MSFVTEYEIFRVNLIWLRDARGFGHAEFADAAGVDDGQIRRLVKVDQAGLPKPGGRLDEEKVALFARALRVPAAVLFLPDLVPPDHRRLVKQELKEISVNKGPRKRPQSIYFGLPDDFITHRILVGVNGLVGANIPPRRATQVKVQRTLKTGRAGRAVYGQGRS